VRYCVLLYDKVVLRQIRAFGLVFVRTSVRLVRTTTTSGQFSPVFNHSPNARCLKILRASLLDSFSRFDPHKSLVKTAIRFFISGLEISLSGKGPPGDIQPSLIESVEWCFSSRLDQSYLSLSTFPRTRSAYVN